MSISFCNENTSLLIAYVAKLKNIPVEELEQRVSKEGLRCLFEEELVTVLEERPADLPQIEPKWIKPVVLSGIPQTKAARVKRKPKKAQVTNRVAVKTPLFLKPRGSLRKKRRQLRISEEDSWRMVSHDKYF